MNLRRLVIFPGSTKLFQQGSSSAFQLTFAFTRSGVPSGLEEKTANETSVPFQLAKPVERNLYDARFIMPV